LILYFDYLYNLLKAVLGFPITIWILPNRKQGSIIKDIRRNMVRSRE